MTKQLLLGTAAALLIAVPASALTMTPIKDRRVIEASAMAGQDSDSDGANPVSPFADFANDVDASAMEDNLANLTAGDAEYGIYGSSAHAGAFQESQIRTLSISGGGAANAGGNHGEFHPQPIQGDALTSGPGYFHATGLSEMHILFEIDEAAAFNLSGFLSAGSELAVGGDGNDVINRAGVALIDHDTDDIIFSDEVSDDTRKIFEEGILAAGTYELWVEAYAEVFGQGIKGLTLGDADGQDIYGYETSASFRGVELNLRAIDQPIPEPVTTSLVGMSLGALVLRTSRRRRA